MTINGIIFGSVTGALDLNAIPQTVASWTPTQIAVLVSGGLQLAELECVVGYPRDPRLRDHALGVRVPAAAIRPDFSARVRCCPTHYCNVGLGSRPELAVPSPSHCLPCGTRPDKMKVRIGMSKEHLHELVDSLPDAQVPVAMVFLSELGDKEVIDGETAARLDAALAEPGDNVTLEELRRRCGL